MAAFHFFTSGAAMARGINKVILIGNLGQDPETRTTPGGTTVTNLRIATSESWRDKQSGEMKEQTEWHTVVCWNRLGEIAAEYLRKGSQVYIEGRLRTRKWQDKSGTDRYSTEVQANEMQMLGARGGGAPAESRDTRDPGSEGFSEGRAYASESRGGGGGAPRGGAGAGGGAGGGGGGADFDDDIPF